MFFGRLQLNQALTMQSCLVRILLFICYFHCSFQIEWDFKKNAEDEWNRMAAIKPLPGAMPKLFRTLPSESDDLWLPAFVKASSFVDQKALFEPEMVARPLPDSAQTILFPTTTPLESTRLELLHMLCHLDRIYLRIRRDFFKTIKPWRFLTLGKCVVNQGSAIYYYFLYSLAADCDFTFQSGLDSLTVKNVLRFHPTTIVLRDMPFHTSVQCNYHRYIHSYKVGIRPNLQGGVLYKSLRMKRPFLIIPQDASGNEMTTPYNMGDTMFFEVKQPDGAASSANERIIINKCFITSSFIPSSTQKAVIDNYGCMVDGLESESSRFLAGSSMMTQRFSIGAGVLEMASSTQQLFMHCEVSLGEHLPSVDSKACNYDLATEMWTELYGDVSVCSCCDDSCTSPRAIAPRASAPVTVRSRPWKMNYGEHDLMKKVGYVEEMPSG